MPSKDQLGQCRVRGCRTKWRSAKTRLCYKHRDWREPVAAKPALSPQSVGCSKEGCENPVLAVGLCSEHQYSLYLELNEETISFVEDVFGDKIVADEDGCWIWTGRVKEKYSSLMVNGRWVTGHRWLYMHLVGPIPNGQELHHECEKTRCVRPGHLRPLVPLEHRHITAFVNWMFTIAPNGTLAIDNVTRSQHERRYAETYRLPFDETFMVEESEFNRRKLPIPPG